MQMVASVFGRLPGARHGNVYTSQDNSWIYWSQRLRICYADIKLMRYYLPQPRLIRSIVLQRGAVRFST